MAARGTPGTIDELPLSAVVSSRCERGPRQDNPLPVFLLPSSVSNVYIYSALIPRPSPNNSPSGPLQYKVNTVRGEASARFFTIQPTPTLRRPAFSISYSTVAHKYARTYTGKSTLNTHSSHARNHTHTHTERRGGELMHCHPQQQDCEHSRNKYPVLVIKFSSRARSLVGPSAFPGERYTRLTLS